MDFVRLSRARWSFCLSMMSFRDHYTSKTFTGLSTKSAQKESRLNWFKCCPRLRSSFFSESFFSRDVLCTPELPDGATMNNNGQWKFRFFFPAALVGYETPHICCTWRRACHILPFMWFSKCISLSRNFSKKSPFSKSQTLRGFRCMLEIFVGVKSCWRADYSFGACTPDYRVSGRISGISRISEQTYGIPGILRI